MLSHNLNDNDALIVKTVILSNGKVRYNIKLTKKKSRKNILNLVTGIFGGLITGAFAFYLYKKYVNSHKQTSHDL